MGILSISKRAFNVDHLAHAAKAIFLKAHETYRPNKLTLKQIFAQTVTRTDVPSQMLSMAKKFDLNECDIAQPNWRAAWIVENCNSCWAGKHCFKDHNGAPKKDPGIIAQRCPNYDFYQSIAIAKKVEKQIEKNAKGW